MSETLDNWLYALELRSAGKSHEEIGLALGKSRSRTSNLLRLAELPAALQVHMKAGRLGLKVAEALVGLPGDQAQEIATRAMTQRWSAARTRREVQCLRRGSPALPDPDVAALTSKLSELLGAQVRLQAKADGSGTLAIDYADLDCLDGVLERLGYQPG